MGVEPTKEQVTAVELAASGKDLTIEALAGTGKTTTLEQVAQELKGKGQYVAFNRAIVEDSRGKFRHGVASNTAHSLAYRWLRQSHRDRVGTAPRMSAKDLANWLGAKGTAFDASGEPRYLESGDVAREARNTVRNFSRSADDAIGPNHVPPVPYLSRAGRQQLTECLLPLAEHIWHDIMNPEGELRFEHDHYLKMWQLSRPIIAADFIMFDEAQDADPVMLDVVTRQNAQKIFVGDQFQAIYEWRGAVNALERLSMYDKAWLTQSFRFGPEIAEVANGILGRLDAPKPIRGNPEIQSSVGPGRRANAVLCRTNAEVVSTALQVRRRDRRFAVVGGTSDLINFIEACQRLMMGQRTNHPELAPFVSWSEVLDWVDSDAAEAGHLVTWVRLIDSHVDLGPLLDGLNEAVPEEQADVIISTAHRSKGREWETVYLAADFAPVEEMETEELRLAYVASTRARRHLDNTAWVERSTGDKTKARPTAKPTPRTSRKPQHDATPPARPQTTESTSTDQRRNRTNWLKALLDRRTE